MSKTIDSLEKRIRGRRRAFQRHGVASVVGDEERLTMIATSQAWRDTSSKESQYFPGQNSSGHEMGPFDVDSPDNDLKLTMKDKCALYDKAMEAPTMQEDLVEVAFWHPMPLLFFEDMFDK